MSWVDEIEGILRPYTSGSGGAASAPANTHEDFMSVAKAAPSQVMADALAHAFRSDQTPSFPEMALSLFQGSNPEQKAGLLNQLIGSVSPSALASIPGLSDLVTGPGQPITAEQADQITAEQARQAAEHAQRANSTIVDQVSRFYAAHPTAVKALGTAVVTLVMQHIARRSA